MRDEVRREGPPDRVRRTSVETSAGVEVMTGPVSPSVSDGVITGPVEELCCGCGVSAVLAAAEGAAC